MQIIGSYPYFCSPYFVLVLRLPPRSYLAFFLLLCLTRTLLPEAWVLALHHHAHTTEQPALRVGKGVAGARRTMLTPKHTHCQTEQFYNVAYRGTAPVVVPQPRVQLCYRPLAVPTTLASSATVLRRTALRGPPLG